MSGNEFHRFLRLPWELRRQIWEDAVHPIGGGIHTFTLADRMQATAGKTILPKCFATEELISMARYLPAIPEREDNGEPNKSAFMWDAGLWTACKESREAIKHSLTAEHWSQFRRNLGTQYSVSCHWEQVRLRVVESASLLREHGRMQWWKYENLHAITLAPQSDGGHCHVLVRPYRDAIKPTFDAMCTLITQWRDLVTWDDYLFDFPFLFTYQGCGPIGKVVIDYDPSWCLDWPTDGKFGSELSPRNFAYHMLMQTSRLSGEILLIDRGIYQDGVYHLPDKAVRPPFYDCNDEYVQVDYDTAQLNEPSAAHFKFKLGESGDDFRDRISHYYTILEPGFLLSLIKFNVCILRPRSLMEK